MTRTPASRPRPAGTLPRALALLGAVAVLAAGGSGGDADPAAGSAASDGGGTTAASGASDGGTVVVEPSDGGADEGLPSVAVGGDPIAVTPAPEGFSPPAPCPGDGMSLGVVGSAAEPALPERGGESLAVTATAIDGEKAVLTASVGDGAPQEIAPAAIGGTVSIEDQWTLSVTSVCADTHQVEFDLID